MWWREIRVRRRRHVCMCVCFRMRACGVVRESAVLWWVARLVLVLMLLPSRGPESLASPLTASVVVLPSQAKGQLIEIQAHEIIVHGKVQNPACV